MRPLLSRKLDEPAEMFWARAQSATAPRAALSATRRTVLVIDDDAVLLELIYAVLSAAELNILTTTRGAKGLEMLCQAAGAVHVVLLDYQMPVVTGAQLLPTIRQLAPAVKVLGVSGTAQQDLPPEFRDKVDLLLSKPFTRGDLIAAVTALLPDAQPGLERDLGLRPIPESGRGPIAPTPAIRHR